MEKLIYSFDEASGLDKNQLGGKGLGLIDMTSLGLPVPPGFIVTTDAGLYFSNKDFNLNPDFISEIDGHLKKLADKASNHLGNAVRYGDNPNPFLVSVRSGAPISMPGQMSTILNVGLSPDNMGSNSFDPAFGVELYWAMYRSFAIALGADRKLLAQIEAEVLGNNSSTQKEKPQEKQEKILGMLSKELGDEFAEVTKDPRKQLLEAIKLVWNSWDTVSNQDYRKSLGLTNDTWTAVVIQMMVYGNKNDKSGSGVVYSRDLISGKKVDPLSGSFLFKAQGEEIVSGESKGSDGLLELQKANLKAYSQLKKSINELEKFYRRPLDIEFTIDDSKLWFLQARPAPVSDRGLVQFVVDQTSRFRGFRFSEREAVEHISPSVMERLNLPTFSDKSRREALEDKRLISTGIPASPGAGVGKLAITKEHAEQLAAMDEKFIWVKDTLDPKEHQIMRKSAGVISMGSSVGSHGAIMANVLKRPCVVCCDQLTEVNEKEKYVIVSGKKIYEEDEVVVSVDAVNGYIFLGELEKVTPKPFPALKTFVNIWEKYDGTKENNSAISPDDGRPHSPWGNATLPKEYKNVDIFRHQIIDFLNEKTWNTEKAQVVEAMKIIPEPMRIKQVVVDARNKPELEAALLDVIKEKRADGTPKYWNGPRTALGPGAEGSAPWQMGMKTEEQIYSFLSDRNFKGVEKAKSGGYPRWIDPDPGDPWKKSPAQIIAMYDPAEKGVEEFEQEHFVCNISCRSNPDEVTVDINLGTAQLRSFETIKPEQLVRLTMELRRENPYFLGRRVLRFGKNYWNINSLSSAKSFSGLSGVEVENKVEEMTSQGELSEDLYIKLVGERNFKVARFIESIVFGEWWIDYQLAYRMRALDEVYSLQVLELQGRADDTGAISWFLVYDAKGRDEKKTISDSSM